MNRREFLGGLALLPLVQGPAAFRHVRGDVGIFTGPGGTIGWYAGRDAALLVDSQFPGSAVTCLGELRRRTGAAAIDVLINTHHHGDHTAGNQVLRPAVRRIVQHDRCARAQRTMAQANRSEAQQAYADVTFSDRWTVDLGAERVTATYFGPAHTGGDIVVAFEQARVVHLGDFVFNAIPPFVDRAAGASIRSWIVGLERIAQEYPDAVFIFGHARNDAVTGALQDVLNFRDYLNAILEHVGAALRAGRSREEVVALREVPGFANYGDIVKSYSSPIPMFTLAHVLTAAFEELSF